ncbi:hypothetical protein WN943_013847 [Citrus x changshan-huyou]
MKRRRLSSFIRPEFHFPANTHDPSCNFLVGYVRVGNIEGDCGWKQIQYGKHHSPTYENTNMRLAVTGR